MVGAPILVLCEDQEAEFFHPLSDTRAVFELRAGIFSARERAQRQLRGRTICALTRPGIAASYRASTGFATGWEEIPHSSDAVFLNGRLLGDEAFAEAVFALSPGQAASVAGRLAAARLGAGELEECRASGLSWPAALLEGLPRTEAPGEWIDRPWDLVARNPAWLVRDAESMGPVTMEGVVEDGAHLKVPERIRIGAGSRIEACCYIDASGGPVVIGEDVTVRSHTRIEGPCWIGPGTELLGGRVGEGTSLGPQCRIAGEIEETVVQGYSNKRHHGFVGHSYLGEWVNLGALTTTSDLKNNYGPVRMWHRGAMADTSLMKLGSLVGDHAKTAIGTLLGTGTSVGVMSNVFRVEPPRHVPSFQWMGEGAPEPHRWAKAGPLLHTVLGRRGVRPTPEYVQLFERLAREAGAV